MTTCAVLRWSPYAVGEVYWPIAYRDWRTSRRAWDRIARGRYTSVTERNRIVYSANRRADHQAIVMSQLRAGGDLSHGGPRVGQLIAPQWTDGALVVIIHGFVDHTGRLRVPAWGSGAQAFGEGEVAFGQRREGAGLLPAAVEPHESHGGPARRQATWQRQPQQDPPDESQA